VCTVYETSDTVAGQSIRTGLLLEAAAGDTIASIARRFGRTAAEVAAVNPHAEALGVEPGTRVCVLPDVAGNDGCPPPGVTTCSHSKSLQMKYLP
jgi:hypothetical protein